MYRGLRQGLRSVLTRNRSRGNRTRQTTFLGHDRSTYPRAAAYCSSLGPRTVATGVSQFARMRSEDLRCGVLQPWAVGKAPSTAAASCKEQRKNRRRADPQPLGFLRCSAASGDIICCYRPLAHSCNFRPCAGTIAFECLCKQQEKNNRAKTGDEQETAIPSTKRASVLRLATGSPSSKPWRPLRCDNAGRPSANLVNTYLCKILVTHASEIVPADPRRIQCQPFPGYVSFFKIWARWAAFEASIGGQSASALGVSLRSM